MKLIESVNSKGFRKSLVDNVLPNTHGNEKAHTFIQTLEGLRKLAAIAAAVRARANDGSSQPTAAGTAGGTTDGSVEQANQGNTPDSRSGGTTDVQEEKP